MNRLTTYRGRCGRTRWLLLAVLLAQVTSAFCAGVVTNFTQAALESALAGGGTVTFATNGTITLASTLSITQDTTLDATGYQVTLSGGAAVRLFTVTNATLVLNGLTLADGRDVGANAGQVPGPGEAAAGACVFSLGGTVNLTACTLTNHSVQGGNAELGVGGYYYGNAGDGLGAALYSSGGQLSLTNCLVVGCTAVGGAGGAYGQYPGASGLGRGGALCVVGGRLNLEGVTLSNNTAVGGLGQLNPNAGGTVGADACAGAVYATNSLLYAARTVLTANAAVGGSPSVAALGAAGAGNGNGGAVFLAGASQGFFNLCLFSANSATGGNPGSAHSPAGSGLGGAVFNQGQFQALDCTFEGNGAAGSAYGSMYGARAGLGGALYSTTSATLAGSTFDNNTARGGAGYYYTGPVPGGPGEGGALWSSGVLAATNCTWSGNRAVGGGYPYEVGSAEADAIGGALYLSGTVASLVNVTLANNYAGPDPGMAANGLAQGGAVADSSSAVLLANSILAYSTRTVSTYFGTAVTNCNNVSGTVTDAGYNLSSDSTGAFTNTGSLLNTDPLLDALADNGGPTQTLNLGLGSPARDAIPSGYPATDQRGLARPQGPAADIGAVEADLVPTTRVRVETVPAGLSITADGTTVVSTPHTFFWETGSCHTLDAGNPGIGPQGTNAQYFWTSWSNGGAVSNQVCPTQDTTNTAYFRARYYLTVNPGTNSGGTASPNSGWYDDGQVVTLTAAPSSGFTSSGWTGTGPGTPYTGPNNPAQVTMNGWVSETPLFTYTNPCYFSISPTNAGFPATQQLGVVQVANPDTNCLWTILNPCGWVIVTSWSPGSPTVNYFVEANSDTNARSCTLTIAGQPFTITQAGGCNCSLSQGQVTLSADPYSGSFAVTAAAGCPWTAISSADWLHTTNSGVGSGIVYYQVDANPTTDWRPAGGGWATITVAEQVFAVSQMGRCVTSLGSPGITIGAGTLSGVLTVNAGQSCPWTAFSDAPWLRTTSSGTGPGLLQYSADANPGTNSRTGDINVQGQVFTVTQAGTPCTFRLGAGGTNLGPLAMSGLVTVTAGYECSWTAVSDAPWLHATNSGTGPGLVSYSADANPDTNSRTGTITVVDQLFTVTQQGVSLLFTNFINGTFHGLVSIGASPIGQVTLSTTTRRTFTGRLFVDGAGHAFHGQFDVSGHTNLVVLRRGHPGLELNLHLEDTNTLVGTVAEPGGAWVASLQADRAVFSDSTRCDYAGLYTFAIPGSTNPGALPGGDSYGSLKVNSRGGVTMAGSLADGTPLAGSTFVAADGRVPLFAALYQNQGLLGAWAQLPLDATNALSGQGNWTKPPGLRFYPLGLDEPVTLFGMKYTAPVHEPLFDFTDGLVALAGGNLPEPMNVPVALLPGNKAEPVGTNHLHLSFDAASGRFTGSFSLPPAQAGHRFRGILIRPLQRGYGYFLGPTQSGSVRLGASVP